MSLVVDVPAILEASESPLLGTHESWCRVRLGDIATILNGFAFKSKMFSKVRGVPLIRIRDITEADTACLYDGPFEDQYIVEPGSLLVGMDGEFKAARWYGPKGLLNQRVCKITLDERFYLPAFVDLALPAYLDAIHTHTSSQTVTHLSSKTIADIPLPLPPLAEQRRIIGKVEVLFGHVNAGKEQLARVPFLLKRFRQAVLAAACSGALTEDWRTSRKLSAEGIKEEVSRARHKAGRRQATPPTDEFELSVPEGWIVVSVDELAVQLTSGSRAWSPYYSDDGYGTFVMAQNVRPMLFDRSSRQGVAPPEGDPERERTRVRQDDILVTIVGANTGDVCRVDVPVEDHFVCQSVALVRCGLTDLSRYLELWLNSPSHGQLQYRTWTYGEGRPHLSFDHLRATSVALPSLDEQREIVCRVGALFRVADAIEKRVVGVSVRAERLPQAILTKAFAGELVPTEAELARVEGREYEPAALLLERIRAEHSGSPAGGDGKRQGRVRVARGEQLRRGGPRRNRTSARGG